MGSSGKNSQTSDLISKAKGMLRSETGESYFSLQEVKLLAQDSGVRGRDDKFRRGLGTVPGTTVTLGDVLSLTDDRRSSSTYLYSETRVRAYLDREAGKVGRMAPMGSLEEELVRIRSS